MSNQRLRFALSAMLMLAAGLLCAANSPPRSLHLVGDHWTAWTPPAQLPANAKVYTVAPGDTLWALAAKNLGNPHLWPQIWEKNQYILDAHWIYPGDPLLIDVTVAPSGPAEAPASGSEAPSSGAGAQPETTAATGAPTSQLDFASAITGAPSPLGAEDDIYCSGFIGESDEPVTARIRGSEYQVLSPQLFTSGTRSPEGVYGLSDAMRYNLASGDIVYLDGGKAAGLFPGQILTAIDPQEVIRHPRSGEVVGRFYGFLGRVRLLAVQESSAIAEILNSCNGITVGARLVPFEPEPIPLARRSAMRPVNDPPAAESLAGAPVILLAEHGLVSIGQDHVVFIERSAKQDMAPGDIFTVYRENREGFPPVVMGEVAVLAIKGKSATAKVIESRFPMYVGDLLERK